MYCLLPSLQERRFSEGFSLKCKAQDERVGQDAAQTYCNKTPHYKMRHAINNLLTKPRLHTQSVEDLGEPLIMGELRAEGQKYFWAPSLI